MDASIVPINMWRLSDNLYGALRAPPSEMLLFRIATG
jgi:hypothetical protein